MTTRIAIAGAGLIGRDHLAALAATPGCELAAIVDPNPAAADIARAAGAPWYPRLPDLLEADRPDGVVLATPNPHHLPGALECMAAGVPVLVEKPLADSAQAARALHGGRTPGSQSARRAPPHPQRDHAPRRRDHRLRRPR